MSASKSLTRLEAFSDGVFAIAITLLIIEIKVPKIEEVHSASDLTHALLHLWPSFFAFFYTFGGILVQWVFHHNIIGLLDKTSRPFLFANGFLLLTIVVFPFPTAVLGEYINTGYAMPAIVFYSSVSVINALAWFLFYRAIDKPKKLRTVVFSDKMLTNIKKSNYLSLVIYVSTTALAIWLPYVALAINVALWLLWTYWSLVEKE